MQLKLAFLNQDDQPLPPPAAAPWDQMDEKAHAAALEILARLIARTLEAKPAKEASDE